MPHSTSLSDIRREYGDLNLSDADALANPIEQFNQWFLDVLKTEMHDPTAMLLSTADEQGHPDSRVVLLKGIEEGGFVFYTNYQSTKAKQIDVNPYVALNFYWPSMARQVRIRGRIQQVSEEQSNAYFATRPKGSQLSAIISAQSREISGLVDLEQALNDLITSHQQALVVRPQHWGGYRVTPYEFEFWQGRDNRLHDRIQYVFEKDKWHHRRLAP